MLSPPLLLPWSDKTSKYIQIIKNSGKVKIIFYVDEMVIQLEISRRSSGKLLQTTGEFSKVTG